MQRLTRIFPALRPAGIVAGAGGSLTAEAVLAAVMKSVGEFAGSEPPRDDMTVMVIRFN